MSIDDTRAANNAFPEREWTRLERGAAGQLEYIVTMHALESHLPKPNDTIRVLDAGGGPGRYTIALAERGYRTTLLDLSPELLDFATSRFATIEGPVRARIEGTIEASITDLSTLPDHSFDAVLCLGGPLSHILDPQQRTKAVLELKRVCKPDGPLFLSVMNRLGAYRSAVQWIDWFDGAFPHIFETGDTIIGSGRAPAHFFTLDEFRSLLHETGLTVKRLYGCQGIGAHLDEVNLLKIMDDPVRWPWWKQELLATCDDPSVIGVANHILAVTTPSTL